MPKEKRTKLNIRLLDYNKAYDMLLHLRIIATMEIAGLVEIMINMISRSIDNWNTNLNAKIKLETVPIKRGIVQGESFFTTVICNNVSTVNICAKRNTSKIPVGK